RALTGRGLPGAPVGAGATPRARGRLRAGVARPAGTLGRDPLDTVRAPRRTRRGGAPRERRLAAGGRGPTRGDRRADEERVPASSAPRGVLRPGSHALHRPDGARSPRGALAALLGRARDPRHLQRDPRRDRDAEAARRGAPPAAPSWARARRSPPAPGDRSLERAQR